MVEVRITGVEEVKASILRLSNELEQNLDLNRELSTSLARKASTMAPRLSGALASSVVGNPSKEKAQIVAGKGAVPYAGVTEYGWPQKGREAKPYLRPAVNDSMNYILATYDDYIGKAIRKYELN